MMACWLETGPWVCNTPRFTLRGREVLEFVCDRIVPGCPHIERADTAEKLLEQAMDHLRERHRMDYIDRSWEERVRATAIIQVPGR